MFARTALVLASTLGAFAFVTSAHTASAIEVRHFCTIADDVPAPSVTGAFKGYGTTISSTSGATYGNSCNDEFAIEATGIAGESAELNEIVATSVYPIAATANSVCPTMSMQADLWGYTAQGGWVNLGTQAVKGVYTPPVMFFGSVLTPGECVMTAKFQGSLLAKFSSTILAAHANQLSGTELPVSLTLGNLQTAR